MKLDQSAKKVSAAVYWYLYIKILGDFTRLLGSSFYWNLKEESSIQSDNLVYLFL
jgi:hypothetical protein